ncbi:MAG: DUF1553 domain-containing protein [Planctomycetales bacterium]|nr:DUF1553 domain-containing protein [Planctomycetales bacterium]
MSRVANPIDAFIIKDLESAGLRLNRPADRRQLLRRITFDLTGLPPTADEQQAFLEDRSPLAYERVVDRLLASPQYGARWAQHWLDVVRFAETDGFKSDVLRPSAYRYRDYVIRSFNSDRPYDDFVRQQLAGDEFAPDDPEALIATGLNRLYPDEDNAANLFQRRQEILDDLTETTGLAFLGLTMGCAQCHDHKFDDILQEDYFRLQAFFAPIVERDDIPYAALEQKERYEQQLKQWHEATAAVRDQIDALLAKKRDNAEAYMLTKFEPAIQECYKKPADERTPYEEQIARMAAKQVLGATSESKLVGKLSKSEKTQYDDLKKQLQQFDHLKPDPLPVLMAVTDLGDQAPPTYILDGGNWRNPMGEVDPGFPLFLDESDPTIQSTHADHASSGRRAALAQWLVDGNHPLTARVIVNRLWHHHFGRGIVATPNDFGIQGDPPTHPELLDWLSVHLVRNDWSLKSIHRLIVTSSTYQQSTLIDLDDPQHALAARRDPGNRLWWHAERRRLEGEAIRDAMLSASGRLNNRMFGESTRPKLPEGASKRYAWDPDKNIEDQRRRSVFVFAKRNMRYPMFDSFDYPDMHNSCAVRTQSTTPPQALLMLNGDDALALADEWAGDLRSRFGDHSEKMINAAFVSALGRSPTDDEVASAQQFLSKASTTDRDGIGDFLHALFNCNEFIYID